MTAPVTDDAQWADGSAIDALARILIEGRERQRPVEIPDPELIPPDRERAEAVDDRVAELTGWPVLGWKIGCTSANAQALLGADGPFAGRVYALHHGDVTLGPDQLGPTGVVPDPIVEGELAFTVAADIDPGAVVGTPGDLVPFLADARPAIELVGGRFDRFLDAPLTCVIADAGANLGLVVGEPVPLPTPEALIATAARLELDGEVTGSGTGADALGGPLRALAWLVDNLSARGIALAAGQVVTTGTVTRIATLGAGSVATLTLDGIGSVTVTRAG